MKIGILGGGLAGLSLRGFLKHDTEVMEKEPECGGLCRSVQADGFTFDQGGHMLFSRDNGLLGALAKILGANAAKRRRNNKVYYDERFIKYPFENGLAGLAKKDNFECLYGCLKNDYPAPNNFKEWLYYNFGKGLTDKYLLPYNKKIWKFAPEKMGLEWVARIPKPPLEDIVKSSLGIETEGYLHQLHYLYPRQGGIQALVRSLESIKGGPVTKGFTIKEITNDKGDWVVSNGASSKRYDKLISTIPIFDLINSIASVPEGVLAAMLNLKYNSALIVMLGLARDNPLGYTAVYFPGKDTPYHRVCFMHNFSPRNAPSGKAALIAEITCKEADAFWQREDQVVLRSVINSLDKKKIIDKRNIELGRVHRIKYAYVIYDLDYQKNLSVIRQYLKKQEIMLCGRFAEFEYINMDEVFRRGRMLARHLNNYS